MKQRRRMKKKQRRRMKKKQRSRRRLETFFFFCSFIKNQNREEDEEYLCYYWRRFIFLRSYFDLISISHRWTEAPKKGVKPSVATKKKTIPAEWDIFETARTARELKNSYDDDSDKNSFAETTTTRGLRDNDHGVRQGDPDPEPRSNSNSNPASISIPMAHAILSIFAWGVLMPVGALLQRHRRFVFPPEYIDASHHVLLHGILECLALMTVIVDWAISIQTIHLASHPHCFISVVLYLAIIAQFGCAWFFRPDRGGDIRRRIHIDLGHLIVFGGMVNAFEGIHRFDASPTSRGIYLIFVIVLFTISKILDRMPGRRWGLPAHRGDLMGDHRGD